MQVQIVPEICKASSVSEESLFFASSLLVKSLWYHYKMALEFKYQPTWKSYILQTQRLNSPALNYMCLWILKPFNFFNKVVHFCKAPVFELALNKRKSVSYLMRYGSAEEHGTPAYVAFLNSAFMNFPIM